MQAEKLTDKGLRPQTPPTMGMPSTASMLMVWARATTPRAHGRGVVVVAAGRHMSRRIFEKWPTT
jgi:hypothetical protein